MLKLMQIVMTAVVCCWAHLMTPADPRKTSPVLGVCLQHLCSPHCALMQEASLHCLTFVSRQADTLVRGYVQRSGLYYRASTQEKYIGQHSMP